MIHVCLNPQSRPNVNQRKLQVGLCLGWTCWHSDNESSNKYYLNIMSKIRFDSYYMLIQKPKFDQLYWGCLIKENWNSSEKTPVWSRWQKQRQSSKMFISMLSTGFQCWIDTSFLSSKISTENDPLFFKWKKYTSNRNCEKCPNFSAFPVTSILFNVYSTFKQQKLA